MKLHETLTDDIAQSIQAGVADSPDKSPSRLAHQCLTLMVGALLTILFVAIPGAYAQVVVLDTIAQRVVACAACHGKQGRGASDGFYPRIAGKPAGYLYNQLINFREGRRSNLLMIYLVDHQSDAYLREIAEYFSDQHPPYPAPQAVGVSDAILERGRLLVMSGDSSKNVPACVACHGQTLTGLAPAIPGLVGLPKDYLNAQLGNWKNGARHAAAPDCMAQIASRLSVADVTAAVAWLAAQTASTPIAATMSTSDKLPMSCGSVPQ